MLFRRTISSYKLFRPLRELELSLSPLLQSVKTHLRNQQPDEALTHALDQVHNVPQKFRLPAYEELVRTFLEHNEKSSADRLLDKMKEQGYITRPRLLVHTLAHPFFDPQSTPEQALATFKRMVATHVHLDEPIIRATSRRFRDR